MVVINSEPTNPYISAYRISQLVHLFLTFHHKLVSRHDEKWERAPLIHTVYVIFIILPANLLLKNRNKFIPKANFMAGRSAIKYFFYNWNNITNSGWAEESTKFKIGWIYVRRVIGRAFLCKFYNTRLGFKHYDYPSCMQTG